MAPRARMLAIAVTAGALSLPAGPALAAEISGTVTKAGDVPVAVEGLCVDLVPGGSGDPPAVQSAITDATGAFMLSNSIASGTYRVRYSGCDTTADYIGKYGPAFVIEGAAFAVEASTSLVLGGAIQGTVSGPGGPAQGICVRLEEHDLAQVFNQTTGADGAFAFHALDTSDYWRVRLTDCNPVPQLVTEWYDNVYDQADATQVFVAGTVTLNPVLAQGGTIHGRIVDDGTGVGNLCVSAERVGGGGSGAAISAGDGQFSITALRQGSYILAAERCPGGIEKYRRTLFSGGYVDVDQTASPVEIDDFPVVPDNTPPQTLILSGPDEGTAFGPDVQFTFGADEDVSGFTCALDGQEIADCQNPLTLFGLEAGPHTLLVRAVDTVGNESAGLTRHWTVIAPSTPPATPAPTSPAPVAPPAAFTAPPAAAIAPPVPVPATETAVASAAPRCVVPNLLRKTLKQAKKLLVKARCRLGAVKFRRVTGRRKGTVVGMSDRARTRKKAGARVGLTLAR